MINKSLYLLGLFLVIATQNAFSQHALSSGGVSTGVNSIVSFSIGQSFYTEFNESNTKLSHGVQFPINRLNDVPFIPSIPITVIDSSDNIKPYHGFNPTISGWQIINIDSFPQSEVKIFNSWGNEIWSVIGYENKGDSDSQWFGTNLLGSDVEAGIYYYVINFNDKATENISGWVYLNR